jgi:ABC-2 type transport system permease protein
MSIMRKLCSIINVNLKNDLQSLSLVVVYFGISLICTAVIGVVGIQSFIEPAIKTGKANSETLSYILQLLGYCTAFVVTGISYTTLFSTPLMHEKICGNIESLLATATSAKMVWIAKTIALFIPGFIMGIVFSAGLTAAINVIYLSPNFTFSLNFWTAACTYIALPIVYFSLSLLMNLVGLIGKAMDAGVIGIIFVAGVAAVMIRLVANHTLDARSWPFLLANLVLAGILFILSILFQNKLKTERIILSCQK